MIIDHPEKQDPVVEPAPRAPENLSYAPPEDDEEVPAYPFPQEDGPTYPEEKPQSQPQAQPQPKAYARHPPPPTRTPQSTSSEDSYVRDPHKLVAYLIPFPKPQLKNVPREDVPDRFLVYTPPPPPLTKPAEGEKEAKRHLLQRKWQAEVREAKTSTAKAASWKGVKSRATRGIDWAIGRTTTSGLDFLNRMGEDDKGQKKKGKDKGKETEEDAMRARAQEDEQEHGPAEDGAAGSGAADGEANVKRDSEETAAVGLTELVLVYPTTYRDSPEGMRKEFVESMMRTKSKAEKDAILATGLLPVALAIDTLAMFIWPFGGLVEIDSVWAYASFRGAKVARSTTKRLEASEGVEGPEDESASQTTTGDGSGGTGDKAKKSKKENKHKHLKLTFTPSARVQTLARYLAARCHDRDPRMFPPAGGSPTETEVLEAIGWAPSQVGGERKNYHDEQWEISELKDDLRQVMQKGAREWDKWCKAFEKNPKKALKK